MDNLDDIFGNGTSFAFVDELEKIASAARFATRPGSFARWVRMHSGKVDRTAPSLRLHGMRHLYKGPMQKQVTTRITVPSVGRGINKELLERFKYLMKSRTPPVSKWISSAGRRARPEQAKIRAINKALTQHRRRSRIKTVPWKS